MQKLLIILAVSGVIAAACSSGAAVTQSVPGTTSTPATTVTTTAPATTVAGVDDAVAPDPPTTSTTATTIAVDGPAAPDFTLVLADGTEFSLSAEQKPVYLVFWAEW